MGWNGSTFCRGVTRADGIVVDPESGQTLA